jgi:quercetin dioxygenase-like cupin family protein
MNEEEFRNLAKEKGYGEVELLEVDPGPEEEMHSHEHSVLSLVLSGKFTMTTDQGTKVFITGDFCENPAGTMHQEKAGPDGGSFLYAKKFS